MYRLTTELIYRNGDGVYRHVETNALIVEDYSDDECASQLYGWLIAHPDSPAGEYTLTCLADGDDGEHYVASALATHNRGWSHVHPHTV